MRTSSGSSDKCAAAVCLRRAGLVLALSTAATYPQAQAQVADPSFPATDGVVYAQAFRGDTLYVGGGFHAVGGVTTGGFAALDAHSGEARRAWPRVTGRVYATASDGKGGWYIGGFFTSISGVGRSGLAHVRADGSLDAWNPSVDGQVFALAVACSTVYIGGSFTSVGGLSRANFAAVDAATGTVLSIKPSASSGNVQAIAATDSTVYIGGSFYYFGGQPRYALAAIHARTGATLPWNPSAGPLSIYPYVCALAISDSTVYAGGYFSTIGGQSRACLAAINAATGQVLPWTPNPNASPRSVVVGDSVVYVVGSFGNIAGQTRGRGAAFSTSTGELLAWDPVANQSITCLSIADSRVYVGGSFTAVGGSAHQFVAALDPATGLALPWTASPNAAPSTLGSDASAVYVGGNYTTVGMQPRSNLAAIDCRSGEVLPWDPGANGAVFALLARDSTVYVGGSFGYMGGLPRAGLAGVDASTGAVRAWSVDANSTVRALAGSGPSVYVGGEFTSLAGQTRNHLGAINAATGGLLNWNPDVNGRVLALSATNTALYVAGAFTAVGTQTRFRLASFSVATGGLRGWDPSASNTASALAIGPGRVYVGGDFSNMGLHFVRRMCPVDTLYGLVQEWQNSGADGTINAMAVSGALLFVGGSFYGIGGSARPYLGALDATTGRMEPWLFNASDPVYSLATRNSALYVGGAFISLGGMLKHGLARIPDPFGYATLEACLLSPTSGMAIPLKTTTPVLWSAAGGTAGVQSVDLYLSRSGSGGPWELIGAGIANTGTYNWTVTGLEATDNAYLRLDARDYAGTIVSASSGPFAILDMTTPTLIARFAAEQTVAGVRVEWELGDPAEFEAIWLQRGESGDGPYTAVTPPLAATAGTIAIVDSVATSGQTWWYRLVGTLRGGARFEGSPISIQVTAVPAAFALSAPVPNPCVHGATCVLEMPRAARVRLSVFDVQGREVAVVAQGTYPAGRWQVALEAGRLRAGMYLVRLQSPGVEIIRRLVLLR